MAQNDDLPNIQDVYPEKPTDVYPEKPTDAQTKKPKNIQEFFVQSAIIRSNALVDRIAELEKVIRPNSCAVCYKMSAYDYNIAHSVCKCGYAYCYQHTLCYKAEYFGNMNTMCIKCRPDLKGKCGAHRTTAIYSDEVLLYHKCCVCNKPLCGTCVNWDGHNEKCLDCL